jgi:molybdate/tungstate transport system substrate-binding protein
VLASADYNLIPPLMFPEFADWYIVFASNEFVLRYTGESRYQDRINEKNWFEILQKDGVVFWHPDPGDDPGGYRTLMMMQLAEKHYKLPGLYKKIMGSNRNRLLTASNNKESKLGYTIAYGSSACPEGSRNLHLPDEINLSKEKLKDFYRQAVVKINGINPGEIITLYGEPIRFGITIPKNFPNQDIAIEWLSFLLSNEGAAILERSGFALLKPAVASAYDKIPEALKKYVK